jgi:molybdopterin/thiamine biosynthesis adenylyltransferase/rhodanese-related sulfurtransferase
VWDDDEIRRYSRHLLLGAVGLDGQARLRAARVLVVGAGGLGSPALLYLAAAGVGVLGVADGDVVELSNLQRQVLHDTPSVGQEKTRSAEARLRALNPWVRVERLPAIDADNALASVEAYDLVLDGTDNFASRYLLTDACELVGRPYVYGSVLQFEGQVSVFRGTGGPGYRDLFPTPPPPGSVPSCGEAGVLGVVPGLVGLLQATEALKLILGVGELLEGRLLLVDALGMRFREVGFDRDPARAAPTQLAVDPALCAPTPRAAPRLTPGALAARWAEGWRPYVLDVRGQNEAEKEPFPMTSRVMPHDLVEGLAPEWGGRDVLVVCRSGGRSARAAAVLARRGVPVWDLEGGWLAWAAAGRPAPTLDDSGAPGEGEVTAPELPWI